MGVGLPSSPGMLASPNGYADRILLHIITLLRPQFTEAGQMILQRKQWVMESVSST